MICFFCGDSIFSGQRCISSSRYSVGISDCTPRWSVQFAIEPTQAEPRFGDRIRGDTPWSRLNRSILLKFPREQLWKLVFRRDFYPTCLFFMGLILGDRSRLQFGKHGSIHMKSPWELQPGKAVDSAIGESSDKKLTDYDSTGER